MSLPNKKIRYVAAFTVTPPGVKGVLAGNQAPDASPGWYKREGTPLRSHSCRPSTLDVLLSHESLPSPFILYEATSTTAPTYRYLDWSVTPRSDTSQPLPVKHYSSPILVWIFVSVVLASNEMEHITNTSVNTNADAAARIDYYFQDPPYAIAADGFPSDLDQIETQRVGAVVNVIGIASAVGVFDAATPNQPAGNHIQLASSPTEDLFAIGAQFSNA